MPSKLTADVHKQGKRDEEFDGCGQPEPIAHCRTVLPERQRQQPHRGCAKSRLPKMIHQGREIGWDHRGLSFPAVFRRVFSTSFMSSKVRSPVSTRCAITSLARPPSSASSSFIKRPCASLREMTASKMFALLIRLTQRST